ncbi:hypothetical protein SEMRO_689_G187550.1 [Seminavis robusta]|uniref:Uncharacterized protein n=1 Tax=Seminavis robusta TaxID=568900 RepID=A0A9N8E984_9STRA|nr:hypothetical protein SEMRO_689_G187550.1 [Seminavis robusta]|eukprot:Sro689_g187550.1 n/a (261) ;mRNA; f:47189-48087
MQDRDIQDSEAAESVEGGGQAHEVSTVAYTDTTTAMEQIAAATCTTGMHESDTHELKAVERKMTPEEKAHREEILQLTATAATTASSTTAVIHMEGHEAAKDQKHAAKKTQENQGVADVENGHSNVEDSAYTALTGMAARLDNPHQSGQLSFFPKEKTDDSKMPAKSNPNEEISSNTDSAFASLTNLQARFDNTQQSGQLLFFPHNKSSGQQQQQQPSNQMGQAENSSRMETVDNPSLTVSYQEPAPSTGISGFFPTFYY